MINITREPKAISFNPSIINLIESLQSDFLFEPKTKPTEERIKNAILEYCNNLYVRGLVSKEMSEILTKDLLALIQFS